MSYTKTNLLLKALPTETLQLFAKTLDTKSVLYRLFQCLRPDGGKDIEDLEKRAKYVFRADRKKPQKALSNEAHKLYKLLRKWLIIQELEQDGLAENQLFAQVIKRHKVNKLYKETLNKNGDLLNEFPNRDMWYQLEQMRLFHALYFDSTNDFLSDETTSNFQAAVRHLDDFYAIARLRYIIEQNTRNFVLNQTTKLPRQKEILAQDFGDSPIVQLFHMAARLSEQKDNTLFISQFCPSLEQYIHLADTENQATLVNFRINYAVMRAQGGNADFMKQQYEAYYFAIEKGYLGEANYMHPDHYINAVGSAAALKDFDYASNLLAQSEKYLGQQMENTHQLAEAYFLFYKKDFDEATQLLSVIQFENFHFKLRVRSLAAQCHYEIFLTNTVKNYESVLDRHLDSYQKFIQRHQAEITQQVSISNQNFISILKQLSGNLKEKRPAILENFLTNEPRVILKIWLKSLLKK